MRSLAVETAFDRLRRWSGAAVLAGAVTCALFLLMHYLTAASDESAYDYSWQPLSIDFVRIGREQRLIEKQRFVPPKPRIENPRHRPRAPAPIPVETLLQLPAPRLEVPSYVYGMEGAFDGVGFSLAPEIVPLARVSPVYPPNAERSGIEGWVKVAFTIAEDGGVVDLRVVDADPGGVFDRAALRAISGWRYQPQFVDGQAIRRGGVEVTFEFRLE